MKDLCLVGNLAFDTSLLSVVKINRKHQEGMVSIPFRGLISFLSGEKIVGHCAKSNIEQRGHQRS